MPAGEDSFCSDPFEVTGTGGDAVATTRGVEDTLTGLTNRGAGASNPAKAAASPPARERAYLPTSSSGVIHSSPMRVARQDASRSPVATATIGDQERPAGWG